MSRAPDGVSTISIARTLKESLGVIVTHAQLAFCACEGEQQVQAELLALIGVACNAAELTGRLLEVARAETIARL
jgi:hypothetical protein